ncbi:MAG: hypothetical protein ACJA2N_000521 [Salibacteraceae bacterium]|jgi:hypothetical protein
MKKSLFIAALLLTTTTFFTQAQSGKYGELKKGKLTEYTSKSGEVYKIGDKMTIGTGSGHNGIFTTIDGYNQLGTVYPNVELISGQQFTIKKIYVYGNDKKGYLVSIRTKALVTLNYMVDIEQAVITGEIVSKHKTPEQISDEALAKLKKAKDKYELGVITEDQYNAIREELIPLIQ